MGTRCGRIGRIGISAPAQAIRAKRKAKEKSDWNIDPPFVWQSESGKTGKLERTISFLLFVLVVP
jgi:hypothetical protein